MLNIKSGYHIRGLDGLRFIGSLIILIHHIERVKILFDVPSMRGFLTETGAGHTTMTLFFVLSGFLITYILLTEKIKTNTISIKNFYIRRISRIWPVYYILLILVFTMFVHLKYFQILHPLKGIQEDYSINFLLCFFHLSNFQPFFATGIFLVSHFWSMSVEEQFYAFWPWVVKKTKKYVKIFLIIILVKVSIKLLIAISYRVIPLSVEQIAFMWKIEHFLFKLRFESFAFGGIAAYCFITNKQAVLNFVYKPWVQWLNMGLLALSMPINNMTETIHVFYSVSFAILILNMAGNPSAIFSLNNKYTDYLGKISYGIYMYQIPILIVLLNLFIPYYTEKNNLAWNITLYFFSFFTTIFISILSYEFMEKKIIKWAKNKTDAQLD
jgi:peptidoglycan/LPS O-acetylase OafA/YrhL